MAKTNDESNYSFADSGTTEGWERGGDGGWRQRDQKWYFGFQVTIMITPILLINIMIILTMHYRLGWPLGRFFSQKMFKSKVLFLSNKKIFLSKSSDLWEGYDPDFWPKNLQQTFIKQNLQILRKTFGKARRGPQWNLIFCVVGFLSELRKKAQNSDFHWGPLHGEIGLLKNKYFFLQIFAQ